MATVNNVVVPNFPTVNGVTRLNFNTIWKLTRALKKAGWKYISSGDGTTKDTTSDPKNDRWGSGTPGTNVGFVTNAGAAAASIAAPTRGRSTITGLTGMVAADKGRFLKISGAATGANNNYHQIEEFISATSVRIDARTFAVASDANNGALTWSVEDPAHASALYPSATLAAAQAWYAARGPSTIKIPITSAPAPGGGGLNFLRGENVTQATTGAEGEILGVVFDGVSTGYLVIAPRLRGTGTGVYGWDTALVITGDLSGATVTQVGTALEYRWEVVFWKNTTETAGLIFFGNFEPVADSAQLFSTLDDSAGATALVAPGGGGTGNAFPGFGHVGLGTSTVIGGAANWDCTVGTMTNGNAQIMCADCIDEENQSVDGSWTWALNSAGAVGGHVGLAFYRMDDTEEGDLSPYVTFGFNESDLYTNTRTGSVQSSGSNIQLYSTTEPVPTGSGPFGHLGTTLSSWRGWRRRGLSSGDQYQDFECVNDFSGQTNLSILETNNSDAEKVATAFSTVRVREPVRLVSVQLNRKMRKGTVRWLSTVQGGSNLDTYDSKRFVQLSSSNAAVVAGPWDGTTTPLAS